ncbi:hypothetical protein BHM03_00034468, partial [Ensete ventricosum]
IKKGTLPSSFSPRGEKKRLLPKKPAWGEEMSPRSLDEPMHPVKPARGEETLFLLPAIAEAYSPHEALPRLLLPIGDESGSSRESDAGSPSSSFSSPSSSFSLG